mmetsp:Transcript_9426/g.13758  ORF Transcript_9426/g.13758 Transcript_9426/m.13758 type:complete len:82 (-) Transcript_9426:434-679(-)
MSLDLQVRVSGTSYAVPAQESDTLFDLKCRIFSITAIAPSTMKLIESGRTLQSEDQIDPKVTLSSLKITSASKIMVVAIPQ